MPTRVTVNPGDRTILITPQRRVITTVDVLTPEFEWRDEPRRMIKPGGAAVDLFVWEDHRVLVEEIED
jgi:hypothetical protein